MVGNGKRIKFWRDSWRGNTLYVLICHLCLPFLVLKKLGWGMFEVWSKAGDVGILNSLGFPMVERWRMLRDFASSKG